VSAGPGGALYQSGAWLASGVWLASADALELVLLAHAAIGTACLCDIARSWPRDRGNKGDTADRRRLRGDTHGTREFRVRDVPQQVSQHGFEELFAFEQIEERHFAFRSSASFVER
jgi:hypothetical protein